MFGGEVLVGYLIAWGVRKASRAGSALDAEVDRVLDAVLERLHAEVSELLGADLSLAKLEAEAAAGGQVSERTRTRVRLALEDAIEQRPEAADQLGGIVRQLREIESATGTSFTSAGPGGVAIGGNADLHADRGGIAAIVGHITMAERPSCEACGMQAVAACTTCKKSVCADHAARLDGKVVCLDDFTAMSGARKHKEGQEVEDAWQELLRVLAEVPVCGLRRPAHYLGTHFVHPGQLGDFGEVSQKQLRRLALRDPCPLHESGACVVKSQNRRGFSGHQTVECQMILWVIAGDHAELAAYTKTGDNSKAIFVNRAGQLVIIVSRQAGIVKNMRPDMFLSTMISPTPLVEVITSTTRRVQAILL